MTDGRNDGLVTAVNDVGEPVAIVLHQRLVAVSEWPFRREQRDGEQELQKSNGEAAADRPRAG